MINLRKLTTLLTLFIYFFLQFYSMLERDVVANKTLEFQQITIFAPINEAFQSLKSTDDDRNSNLVLYHMSEYSEICFNKSGGFYAKIEIMTVMWEKYTFKI